MGKVYFQPLDLARISATQPLPVGMVPPVKLDLAHRNAAKKGWPEANPFEVLVGLKTIRNP